MIIEPFAGSAGYALRRGATRQVILRDLDECVIGTWQYLISVSEQEILGLPDLEPGQTVHDLNLPQEARWLIGWWLNKGSAQPRNMPSRWMRDGIRPASYWGPQIRERIASSLLGIRHWKAELGDYASAPDVAATWFIDPPYQKEGRHYRYGSGLLDYADLAEWCQGRRGQVIVCENAGADWLPFKDLGVIKGTPGRARRGVSREVCYHSAPDHN